MQAVPEPAARLNVTYNGQNGDYPDAVSFDLSDGDVKQIATEAIQSGYIPGIAEAENVDLADFVVDRFPEENNLPERLMIRPKTPFGQKLDGKFHGVIVKNKDGSIVPQDQWIVFLVKDNAVPAMLDFYYEECKRQGALDDQLDAVREMINRADEWRNKNPGLCKTPDVEPGEIQA